MGNSLLSSLKGFMQKRGAPSPHRRARDLLTAIDAGGLPLHPGIVNDIARQLGLEVPLSAPMDVTISRIRRKIDK
jgi:hypothetical protein